MEFLRIKSKETFGTVSFVGVPMRGAEYNQGSGNTRKRVGTYCRFLSSRQSETIEVIIPTRVNLSEFNYGDNVYLEDVRAEPMSEGTDNGSISGWRLFAQKVTKGIEKGGNKMAKKNELNVGMEIDSKETFGELIFLRMKSPKTIENEDTGMREDVANRYVVQSSKQLAEEIITIPIDTPVRELFAGDKVEIVSPTTNLYSFGNGNFTNSYIQVFAEDIRKIDPSRKNNTKVTEEKESKVQPK